MANHGKTKPRAAYVYDKAAAKERLLQRRQMYAFDAEFRDAILRAYRNETRLLRDLLLSNPALSGEHCVMLAQLIHWGIEKRKRGRPRGSVPVPNPRRDDIRLIVKRVQWLKLRMFENNRVPKGKLDLAIKQAIQQLDDDDLLEGGYSIKDAEDIIKDIHRELKRGTKKN
jgi:hypothetical protein